VKIFFSSSFQDPKNTFSEFFLDGSWINKILIISYWAIFDNIYSLIMFNLHLKWHYLGLLWLMLAVESRLPSKMNSESAGPAQWAAWETDVLGYWTDVAVDGNGEVYVAGYTHSSLYAPMQGYDDYAVAKLRGRNGSFIWGFQDGSTAYDKAHGVTVDSNGDVYVSGYTESSLYAPIQGNTDYFVTKLSGSNGSFIWGFQDGSTAYDYAYGGVTVDSNGDVYVAGITYSSLYAPIQGKTDYFVTKLSGSNGSFIWGFQDGSTAYDYANGVTVDSNGDVYVAGYTESSLYASDQDHFSNNFFVAKLSGSLGGFIWGFQDVTTAIGSVYDVWVMVNGNIGVGGTTSYEKYFTSEIDADAGVLVSIDDDSATHFSSASYTSDDHVYYEASHEASQLVTAGCSFDYYGVDGGPPCTPCDVHSSSTHGSSGCICDEGFYSSSGYGPCTACEEGSSPATDGIRNFCTCDSGYQGSNGNNMESPCKICEEGSYSKKGWSSCETCEGLSWSYQGFDRCPYFIFGAPIVAYIMVSVLVMGIVILAVILKLDFRYSIQVALSTIDFLSDVLYVMTSAFANSLLLVLVTLCLFLPMIHFLHGLRYSQLARTNKQNADNVGSKESAEAANIAGVSNVKLRRFFSTPNILFVFWKISIQKRFPYCGDVKMFPSSIEKISNIGYFVLYIAAWTVAGFTQLVYGLVWILVHALWFGPWTLVHFPYYVVVFLVGYTLHQCKLLQHLKVRPVWDSYLWQMNHESPPLESLHGTKHSEVVDVGQVNSAFLAEIIFESTPQLICQTINNVLVKRFSVLSIISVCASAGAILATAYRFGYWWLWMGVPLSDIPIFENPSNEVMEKQLSRTQSDALDVPRLILSAIVPSKRTPDAVTITAFPIEVEMDSKPSEDYCASIWAILNDEKSLVAGRTRSELDAVLEAEGMAHMRRNVILFCVEYFLVVHVS
jgi:hypothetical protein